MVKREWVVVEAMELVKCIKEGIKVEEERSKITILESHSASQMTHIHASHTEFWMCKNTVGRKRYETSPWKRRLAFSWNLTEVH